MIYSFVHYVIATYTTFFKAQLTLGDPEQSPEQNQPSLIQFYFESLDLMLLPQKMTANQISLSRLIENM